MAVMDRSVFYGLAFLVVIGWLLSNAIRLSEIVNTTHTHEPALERLVVLAHVLDAAKTTSSFSSSTNVSIIPNDTFHGKDVQATTTGMISTPTKRDDPSTDAQPVIPSACTAYTNSTAAMAPKGIIVVSLLGRMGNNLFQVAVANRLAEQLCWAVVYRPSWQGPLAHDTRLQECFPGAFVYASASNYSNLPNTVQSVLNISSTEWNQMQKPKSNAQFDALRQRIQISTPEHFLYELEDNSAKDKGILLDDLVTAIRNESMPTRIIHLRGFFIHYGYLQGWLPRAREWLAVDSSCCQTIPSHPQTRVLHWRNFDEADGRQFATPDTDWVQVYQQLLHHDDLQWKQQQQQEHQPPPPTRPIWILTQPSSIHTPQILRLVNLTNATIQTGIDVPDAMCLLQQHASTVFLSYASTFSQGPVLFGNAHKTVHYPLIKLQKPAVTVLVPDWHYHLVQPSGVTRLEVPFHEIHLG